MKKYRFQLIHLLIYTLFIGCNADDEESSPIESTLTIVQNENSVLNTGINFTLTSEASAYIEYWPTHDETSVMTTPVSSEKKAHLIQLFRLKEATDYSFKILSNANNGKRVEILYGNFTTNTIPAWVKEFYDETKNEIHDSNQGYFLFHNMTKPSCLYLVDNKGKIAWYRTFPNTIKAARLTPKKTIIVLLDELANPMADGNVILETNLAGDTLFEIRKGEKGYDKMLHHDIQMNDKGQIIGITNEADKGLPGDGLLLLDTHGQKTWAWSTFDEINEIDLATYKQPWGNSLSIDTDKNYIVSFRALSQIWKINSSTGEVMWKLGKNGDIKLPANDEFQFQHFAHRNYNGEIMLFDNGSSSRPQSRIVSFVINEATKEAVTKINIALPSELYSAIMGSTLLLPDGNILAASAVNGAVIKMDKNGQVLWTLKAADQIYRVDYVTDIFY